MNMREQVDYLMQGTEYGDEQLKQAMANELAERLCEAEREKRPLRVYCGFDPRTSDLHLGHTVPMRKLRQFQELGHDVIFLIGNYTSLIGDPSDKDKLRPRLTPEEVQCNAETYAEQAYRVLARDKTIIEYNDKWLSKLTFAELIKLASNFTISQFMTRENFRGRLEKGEAIYLHETFYAIMQGYDAYMLKTDVQVGGTDQLFNIVTASRKLMNGLGVKPNVGVILDILPGTDGKIKMSKSLGNHIPLVSSPEDMYGKVMSIPDTTMGAFMRLVTRWHPEQILRMEEDVNREKLHIKDLKMKLAYEIVMIYQGAKEAEKAQRNFITVFQKKDMPDDMPEYRLIKKINIVDFMADQNLSSSKGAARRLIKQKAVRLDGKILESPDFLLERSGVLRVGKRKFIRLVEA
ncbi:tyrosine--tRNA ligase [Thermodesulfobacteriota bacterium]